MTMAERPAKEKKKAAKTKKTKKAAKKPAKKPAKKQAKNPARKAAPKKARKKSAPKPRKKKSGKKIVKKAAKKTLKSSGGAPQADGRERRFEDRVDCRINGRVVSRNNEKGIACEIRDLSRHGARLKFLDIYQGPRLFTLITEHDERHTCALVWTLNTLIGVKFI
jgi:hypothetical protein